MSILINMIAEQAAPIVFVLDDFHVIHAQPVLEMLSFFVEHIPPQMHLILLAEAGRAYTEALQISQATGNIHMAIDVNTHRGDNLMDQGQLRQAARTYSETVQMCALPGGQISPLNGRAYAGLGQLHYEWNDLEAAAKYVHQCIEAAQRWGNIAVQATGLALLARLEQAHARPEKAREAMRAVEQLLSDNQHTSWGIILLQSAMARLQISNGDLEAASLCSSEMRPLDGSSPRERRSLVPAGACVCCLATPAPG